MNTFAEFQIIGRVGKIQKTGKFLIVSIAAEYGRKNDNGEFESKPFWNQVTIFNEKTVAWIEKNVAVGDLVHSRGDIRQDNYENQDGETVYTVKLAATEFNRLAKKQEQQD